MSKPEDSRQTPELPELQPLVAAVDGLARERKKLAQAIEALGSGQTKKALSKLSQLEKQAQTADAELRTCLAHLELYFTILWFKAGFKESPLAEVTDIVELFQLFGIENIHPEAIFDDPEDLVLAERLVAKIRHDLDLEKRVDTARRVANQIEKLAKAADRKGLSFRGALLHATAAFILLGMEDVAARELKPLLHLVTLMDPDEGTLGPH